MNQDAKDSLAAAVAEANRTLARLQLRRMDVMMTHCYVEYSSLRGRSRPRAQSGGTDSFTMPGDLLAAMRGHVSEDEFAGSERADELASWVDAIGIQLRLQRKAALNEFDIFLCHHSTDKRQVRAIDQQLRKRGILPWLDERELLPGREWLEALQLNMAQIGSCAVVFGPGENGLWQQREMNTAIHAFVEKEKPVIPVILPTCTSDPPIPSFLSTVVRVDFRTLDPDPYDQLVAGIRGCSTAP